MGKACGGPHTYLQASGKETAERRVGEGRRGAMGRAEEEVLTSLKMAQQSTDFSGAGKVRAGPAEGKRKEKGQTTSAGSPVELSIHVTQPTAGWPA